MPHALTTQPKRFYQRAKRLPSKGSRLSGSGLCAISQLTSGDGRAFIYLGACLRICRTYPSIACTALAL
jgi:hypothetical protein